MTTIQNALASLTQIANDLDKAGEYSIASDLDNLIKKIADDSVVMPPAQVQSDLAALYKELQATEAQYKKEISEGRTGPNVTSYYDSKIQQIKSQIAASEKSKEQEAKAVVTKQKNQNVQRLLNQMLAAQGKPTGREDGKVTKEQVALLKQIAPGYETKGWGYLTRQLEQGIAIAKGPQSPQDSMAKTPQNTAPVQESGTAVQQTNTQNMPTSWTPAQSVR